MPIIDFNRNDLVIEALGGRGCYNDLVYKHLGDLGYTGSYNDRMVQFLKVTTGRTGTYNDLMNAYLLGVTGAFTPANLFSSGEKGAWYDPTNLSTLFQDSSGTVPVTATGQPIGRINDRSGNGYHATQSTGSLKPVLNLLSSTIGFSGGYRLKHDMIDDNLLWGGATGDYYIAIGNASGVQFYTVSLVNGGPIPLSDMVGMIILDRPFTGTEVTEIRSYLNVKRTGVPFTATNWVFECNGASYTGRGGNSGLGVPTWTFGDGTVYNTMFSTTEATSPREMLTFETTDASELTQFSCHINNLVGSIPDLSNNTSLTLFRVFTNNLTGCIPDLSANVNLDTFYCHLNNLTGSIPDLSSNTSLANFYCYSNKLTGSIPDLSSNTALILFRCDSNNITGSIPSLSNNVSLLNFICDTNNLSGSIPDLGSNTSLTIFRCNNNSLTSVAPGFSVSITLGEFNAHSNLLSSADVNTILAAFVAANRTTGTRTMNLDGTGNGPPTGTGLTDKATLISRGWTVITN